MHEGNDMSIMITLKNLPQKEGLAGVPREKWLDIPTKSQPPFGHTALPFG